MKKNYTFMFMLLFLTSIASIGQYSKLYEFTGENDLANPMYSQPVTDGTCLYGMTKDGGANYLGCIFKINIDGSGYVKLFDFSGMADGSIPFGYLTLSGSILYGMTSSGGANNEGCIFKINTDGSGYVKLFDFSGTATGGNPRGSLMLSGNVLYGMTIYGGTNNFGCIFKINTDGSGYSKLFDFSGTADGRNPIGSLTLSGNVLYGMTQYGGANNLGCIFKINTDASGYSKLLDFNGTSNGASPYGSLTLSGNELYGMTSKGGAGDWGTIFRINTDGSGYTNLHDFNGGYPYGNLTLSGGILYGMTSTGGSHSRGSIFKINTDGTEYTTLLEFNGVNGKSPYGTLTLLNGVLYGMTYSGGMNNKGCIFKISTDGSGYAKLFDFISAINGSEPVGSMMLVNSILYGMTQYGGTNGMGCIYKLNLDGSGYTRLLNFNGVTNGSYPNGSLTFLNDTLYGMTYSGGENNRGCIFKISTDGSGYSKLLDFSFFTNGADPYGSLIIDNNVLYGMTTYGGANGFGCIFKINTNGSGYSKLLDFQGTSNGASPYGSLTLSDGVLYGMTQYGGANNFGCIFKINTDGSGYSKLLDFNGTTNGMGPYGSLTLSDSTLYGMTYMGGTNNYGCIFKINTDGNGYSKLLDFNYTNGAYPYGSLTLSGNVLYGMTSLVVDGRGNLFKINTDGSNYVNLLAFDDTNGGTPSYTQPVLDKSLYGLTQTGGADKVGVIFKYVLIPGSQASNITFAGITNNQVDLSWTNSDGEKRVVFVKQTSGAFINLENNTTYTASADWSNKGTESGTSGYYCVYNGTGNTVTLTNLSPGTQYTVQVFEYNGNPGGEQYLTAISHSNTFLTLKQSQTITLTPFTTPVTYGTSFSVTAVASSGLVVSFASSNDAVATVSGSTVVITGVGTTSITATQAGDNSYFAATEVSQTLTVNKATLTATANNQTKAYGSANPVLTISYSGFAGSENAEVLDVLPITVTTATNASTVGNYPITIEGGSDNNYDFTYVAGNLEITRATAIIIISNTIQVYDGTPKAITAVTDPTGLTVNVTYNGSATAPVSIGSYAVVATIEDANYKGTQNAILQISSSTDVAVNSNHLSEIYSDDKNIYIAISILKSKASVSIYNIIGECVYHSDTFSQGLNKIEKSFIPGIYAVKIVVDNKIYSEKIVINK